MDDPMGLRCVRGFRLAAVFFAVLLASARGAPRESAGEAILAWIRFEDAAERYAETPYLWLGDVDIRLRIDVRPGPGQALEFLWGSKGDGREALAAIDGKTLTLRHGGYDGFRWLRVPIPEGVGGPRHEVRLARGFQRPAFIAEVRLVGPSGPAAAAPDRKRRAWRMELETSPASRPEAFPAMRPIWDGEPPPNPHPLPDPREEAAFRRAERNGRRANEQFFRCRRFVDGWLARADPDTGLIPRNLGRDRDIWNAKDAAADNYPFMVLTAALTDRPLFEGRMLAMLETETRLTCRIDRLPDTWSFSKHGFRDATPDLGRIIFGGSEYVKDGLLPLTEWLGPSPWSRRMLGIEDDIWKHAPVETPYGRIPSRSDEVNGEMLQASSRIFWMTGDRKYLDRAIRLGDHYLLGGHHPTRDAARLRLRDHGCEIVSGLSELYVACHFAAPEKAKAYREPIHAVFDRILQIGRDARGMLYNWIEPKTGRHDEGICDTWGYNYNGIYAVHLIDGTETYRDAVRHVLAHLPELTEYDWGSADEYADSIEGAINLYNREPVPSAAAWIDTEIRDMWRNQRPDGVIEGWHGDGNSARTAIMYALWKTRGLTVRPWREDVRFGAVRRDEALYVSLTAEKPWAGLLVFDRPRHRLGLHLPLDYPRINQFPEWFTVEARGRYRVRRAGAEATETFTGADLAAGVPIVLKPGREVRLIVTAAEG